MTGGQWLPVRPRAWDSRPRSCWPGAAAGCVVTDVQSLDGPLACLRAGGGQVEALVGDVSSEAFVQSLAAWVASTHGAADVLVNNAGISLIQPAEDTTAAQWQRVMDMNLLGPFLLCRELGRQMLARRCGSIVNVASVAGLGGVIHRAAYNTSKHGLIGLTRTLAAEWGGRGVRVNAVCPGWIKTEMDIQDMGRARTPTPTSSTACRSRALRSRATSPRPSLFSLMTRQARSSTASACRWTAAGPATTAGIRCVSRLAAERSTHHRQPMLQVNQ